MFDPVQHFKRNYGAAAKLLIKLLCGVYLLASLTACQLTSADNKAPQIDSNKFPKLSDFQIESPQEIFALNDDAIEFVDANTLEHYSEKDKLSYLAYAIFDRSQLDLQYKANANTTAQETFYQGNANCLSLTIMTYAMADYLGLPATFQDVHIPEFWTRRNGNTLINRHVNLKVKVGGRSRQVLATPPIIIDFDPQQGMRRFSTKPLTKAQMVSYFYANKAAEFMINDQPSKAFIYSQGAIEKDPKNESAWLNLGVLFSQHGYFDEAEQYYEHAIRIKPNYPSAHENLALLYKRLGDNKKADAQLAKLHKKRLSNPYYHMMLGDLERDNNQHKEAIRHYLKAIAINKRPHEFHFSLAKAYYAIGDIPNAKRYLENAKKRSKDIDSSERYASKIALLAKN